MTRKNPPIANSNTYMEDLYAGQRFAAGPIRVTEEAMIEFAKKYDPQDFHTDHALAKETMFGRLGASGWYTAGMTMRLLDAALPKMKGGRIGRCAEKIGWPHPVFPDDQLSIEVEILEIRASKSNPERGVMRVKNTTFNQRREPVLEMESVIFVPRRQAPEV